MGTEPVVLSSIQNTADQICYFSGENFTAASRVEVDGKILDNTVYVSPGLLMVQDLELKGGESVRIVQTGEGQENLILSGTGAVRYEN